MYLGRRDNVSPRQRHYYHLFVLKSHEALTQTTQSRYHGRKPPFKVYAMLEEILQPISIPLSATPTVTSQPP